MSSRRSVHRGRLLLAIATVSFLTVNACGSDTTDPLTPRITVAVAPTSLSLVQGTSGEVGVTVTGVDGFTGTATITAQNVPAGVMATVGNVQSNGGATTATVTVAVGPTVAAASYTITIRATGSGVAPVSADLTLVVSTAASYELAVSPAQLAISQGASGTTEVALPRTNFTAGVTLSVEGMPTGMTATFDPQPSPGTSSTLTLAVAESTAPATYDLTIRGVATGLSDRTVGLQVLVSEPDAADYLLGVDPGALTVSLGESVSGVVTLTRVNFTGPVTLASEDVPTGVTVSFGTSPTTGSETSLDVAADATAAPGTYTVTIRGTASGLSDKTAELELTVAAASAYTLALSPDDLSVAQGGSDTTSVTLVRTAFTGAVTLALEGAPAGVTGAFAVNPVSGTETRLTIDVGAAVAPGSYDLTVLGTSSLSDRTASLTLTVTEGAGFSLGAVASLSIQQGASGTRSVPIARTGGFTGDVTVTVTGLASGLTASVSPVTTSGASTDVTVSATGSLAPGSYTATIRGNATGLPEATVELGIAVTASSGQQVSLDFSTCDVADRPLWLAYQDGPSASWVRVAGTGNVYAFQLASPTAGIAYVTSSAPGETDVLVNLGTTTELAATSQSDLCEPDVAGKTVGATVSGIAPASGELAYLTLGSSSTVAVTDGAVQFMNVPDGNVHLVGYKALIDGSSPRMALMRDLNPMAGGNIGTIAFATSGFDAAQATITTTGATGDLFWQTSYATSPVASVCYQATLGSGTTTGAVPFVVGGVPTAQRLASEYHVVQVATSEMFVNEAFASLSDRTIAFPTALPTPGVTVLAGAYRRIRAELSLPSEYDRLVTLEVRDDASERSIAVVATTAWLGGGAVSLSVPDFSTVTDWQDVWGPTASATSDWSFAAFGGAESMCGEGARNVISIASGTAG